MNWIDTIIPYFAEVLRNARAMRFISILMSILALGEIGARAYGQASYEEERVQEVGLNMDMAVDRLLHYVDGMPARKTPYYAIDYKRGNGARLFLVSLSITGNYYNKHFTGFYDSYSIVSSLSSSYQYPSFDSLAFAIIRSTGGDRYGLDLGMEWRKDGRYFEVTYGPLLSMGLISSERTLAVERVLFKPPQANPGYLLRHSQKHSNFYSMSLGIKCGVLLPLANHLFLGIELLGAYVTYFGYIPIETLTYDLRKEKVDASANRSVLRGNFSLNYRF